jgi:hypothetical protein
MWERIRSGGAGDRFSIVGQFALSLAHNTAFFIDYPGLAKVYVPGVGKLSLGIDATGYIEKHGYKATVLPFPDIWGFDGVFDHNSIHKRTFTIARTSRGMITHMFRESYYKDIVKKLHFKHGRMSGFSVCHVL